MEAGAGSRVLFRTRFAPGVISLFDGSTVVFNDLLHDNGSKARENPRLRIGKAPIFGKLPQGGHHEVFPRRLMLFITARLINTGSEPVRDDDEKEEVVGTIEPPARPPESAK